MSTTTPERFGFDEAEALRVRLEDAEATPRFGAVCAEMTSGGGFLGLVGELGAGKTTLVQGLVGRLDPAVEASSPTYTLLNEYPTDPPVYHFDLYRLETVDDLETVAYWDYAEERDAIVVVEWIDRVPAAWVARGGTLIELAHADGGARTATVFAPDSTRHDWAMRLDELFPSTCSPGDLS